MPITSVTNGVHVPIWDSVAADELWTHACGKQRWYDDLDKLGDTLRSVTDSDLWGMRTASRKQLIDYVRIRLSRQIAARGASADEISRIERIFDHDILTIGFARRFAPYQRPNLLLHDPERLLRILTAQNRPVQLILAGKAHPQDAVGQDMIRQWLEFILHTGRVLMSCF